MTSNSATVREVMVALSRRRNEDPFARIAHQLRVAKRFRVEEYIRSLDGGSLSLEDDEQRKRDAFFFGIYRRHSLSLSIHTLHRGVCPCTTGDECGVHSHSKFLISISFCLNCFAPIDRNFVFFDGKEKRI